MHETDTMTATERLIRKYRSVIQGVGVALTCSSMVYVGGQYLEGVHWIHVAQGTDKWRAVVNTVMNYCVPQN